MPSPEMLAFNADARTRKAFVSSNCDPIAVRAMLRAPPELERTSTFADCGRYRIEHRGRADARRVFVCIAGGGFFLGPTDAHRALLDELCAQFAAQAALVHHRLAPDDTFPAAYHDVCDAFDRVFGIATVDRLDAGAPVRNDTRIRCI